MKKSEVKRNGERLLGQWGVHYFGNIFNIFNLCIFIVMFIYYYCMFMSSYWYVWSALFIVSWCCFVCKCAPYDCYRVSTQLQSANISDIGTFHRNSLPILTTADCRFTCHHALCWYNVLTSPVHTSGTVLKQNLAVRNEHLTARFQDITPPPMAAPTAMSCNGVDVFVCATFRKGARLQFANVT